MRYSKTSAHKRKWKKDQPHSKNTEKNNTCEGVRIVLMKRELSYLKNTPTEGVATEKEKEYTYCNPYLSLHPYSILTRPD